MRRTLQQRQEAASRRAVARHLADMELDDQGAAQYIGIGASTFSERKRQHFLGKGARDFFHMANKLKFSDEEIISIVRGSESF